MCPLSDEALLDWALLQEEADPEIERHLRACDACRDRSREVLKEQDLLRSAFALPGATPRADRPLAAAPSKAPWPRLGVAALFLVALALGAILAPTARLSLTSRPRYGSKYPHGAFAPIQTDLGIVAQKIAAARETLPDVIDQKSAVAYRELLSQEKGLYLSGMERYLGESSPLSEEQDQRLRRIVEGFYTDLTSRENCEEASRGFRDKVHALLNEDQFRAYEEFSRQGREWQWKTAIALLMTDLSGELDLRFSEAERVRRTLESNYPRTDLPVLQVDWCPPDPLVDNPGLTRAVRASLDASYLRKFDSYLGHVKVARERALKIVRQHKAD
jgi:hypothetical protein